MFTKLANTINEFVGTSYAFILAGAIIIVWAVVGPFVHFSDVWQLSINTGTTIITFLMVFLIQNTQNKDTKAIQRKLDELIHAIDKADNAVAGIENAP